MPIEKHLFPHRLGDRDISILSNSHSEPRHLALFLDAEAYLGHLDAANQIEELEDKEAIRRSVFAFVSNIDEAHRHKDFACNEAYAHYIALDVFGFLKSRIPSLREDGHLVCGLSLSGLASAYIRMVHPERFASALCQSGSFWWNQEWLKGQADAAPPGKFWVSVGQDEVQSGLTHPPSGMRQEVSQFDASRRFAESLRRTGNSVQHAVFDGGHGNGPWARELKDALTWLIGAPPPAP